MRILLCFIAIILSLSGAELIGRRLLPRPYVTKVAKNTYALNRYGFIDGEALGFSFPEKNTSQQYILFIGDSFVDQCDFIDIFSSLLDKTGDGEKYIVGDISTQGWGTDQEYVAFMDLAFQYKPDAVVLVFCLWNDIANNLSAFHEKNQIKPYFIIKDGKLVLCHSGRKIDGNSVLPAESKIQQMLSRIHYKLCRASYLYFYASHTLNSGYQPLFPDKRKNIDGSECLFSEFKDFAAAGKSPYMFTDRVTHYLPMVKYPRPAVIRNGRKVYIGEYGYRLTGLILKEFNDKVNSYGGKFYVLLLPFANDLGWNSEKSGVTFLQADGRRVSVDFMYQIERLKSFCAKNNIAVIDFTKEMEERFSDLSKLIYNTDNVHYNKLGDNFLGRQIYKYFQENICTGR